MTIGLLLMAAGNGARFGGNKLLTDFRGKPLIRWALEAIPAQALAQVVVVTQYDAVAAMAAEFGYAVVRNDAPELGISRTIRLGTEALAACDGILYQVADQPLLRQETVLRLIAAFRAHPERIIAPFAGTRRGNPCLFPADCFPALMALQGDRGGSQVIKSAPERVYPVQVPPEQLYDVDTAAALKTIEQGGL